MMCLGSEHEKDAERGREVAEGRRDDAERGPEDVEQSLENRRCDICVRHHSVRKPEESSKCDSDSCLASLKKTTARLRLHQIFPMFLP